MYQIYRSTLLLLIAATCFNTQALSQNIKTIPLPKAISGVNEEFSGMTIYDGRVYLEPQYGDHKETKLDGAFALYSILADSVGRVIDGKDSALTAFIIINVKNLDQLPDSVKKYYEGFEAISIVNGTVYMSIETKDTYDYCFLLKGKLDTIHNEVLIDAEHMVSLKRYPKIDNAGFESVSYLPKEGKLLAYYEYNAMPKGGAGYLIDTSFTSPPQSTTVPFLYFRITDIAVTDKDRVYGINYFWQGDYKAYLDNDWQNHQEANIQKSIPDLRDSIANDAGYLPKKTTTYARIVTLKNRKSKHWEQVRSFPGYKDNWEGLSLFRKGALVVTDANRSSKQETKLIYLEF